MRVCPRCRSTFAVKTQFCGIDGEKLIDTDRDPLIGATVGRYVIHDRIGRGATGAVYRAVHSELKAEFAIKVLLGELGSDETVVGRFRREAQAASKIRSANVVSVVDFGITPEGLVYLVMEYSKGKPLDQIIAASAPLPAPRVARVVRDVAAGLATAHAQGFVHRDVKPANIFLMEEQGREVAKILDFGIVRVVEANEATQLTREGRVVGTPAYMAPEQWRESQVGPAADLYSLGIVAYEMLVGKKPFRGSTVTELMSRHATEPPPMIELESGLEPLVYELLAKMPEQRPAKAEFVVAAVELWIAHETSGERAANRRSQAERAEPSDAADVGTQGFAAVAPHQAPLASRGEAPSAQARAAEQPLLSSTIGARQSQLSLVGQGTSSRLLLGVALFAFVAAGGALFYAARNPAVQAPERVDLPADPPPRPVNPSPESQLATVLERRGLSVVDLTELGSVAPLYARWKDAKDGPDRDLHVQLTEQLILAVGSAPITVDLLQAKLNRLDPLVGSRADTLVGPSRTELEARYAQFFSRIQGANGPAELEAIAKEVLEFGRSLTRSP